MALWSREFRRQWDTRSCPAPAVGRHHFVVCRYSRARTPPPPPPPDHGGWTMAADAMPGSMPTAVGSRITTALTSPPPHPAAPAVWSGAPAFQSGPATVLPPPTPPRPGLPLIPPPPRALAPSSAGVSTPHLCPGVPFGTVDHRASPTPRAPHRRSPRLPPPPFAPQTMPPCPSPSTRHPPHGATHPTRPCATSD